MKAFDFAIIAAGLDPMASGFEDRFFDAGCDDASISWQKGSIIVDFTREAASFEDAVASAIRDVGKTGAHVERVEPDHLVNMADISERAGLSPAALIELMESRRAHAFPAPVSRITTKSPLWDWASVARWLAEAGSVPAEIARHALFVRQTNDALSAAAEKKIA